MILSVTSTENLQPISFLTVLYFTKNKLADEGTKETSTQGAGDKDPHNQKHQGTQSTKGSSHRKNEHEVLASTAARQFSLCSQAHSFLETSGLLIDKASKSSQASLKKCIMLTLQCVEQRALQRALNTFWGTFAIQGREMR